MDPWWYLQRTALKRLSREAGALKPATPELLDVLKTAYKDRNGSVRLAAAGALTALGVDPGPEVSYDVAPLAPAPADDEAGAGEPAGFPCLDAGYASDAGSLRYSHPGGR